jgi:hypothetical protein
MTDTATPAARVLAFAEAHALTMTAAFVPYSQSRNAKPGKDGKPWLSLNWRITLSREGRPFLETDYAAGSGHAPASKASASKLRAAPYSETVARQKLIEAECERGRPMTWLFAGRDEPAPNGAAILPDLADVLYSLSSGADVLNSASFEDWAGEFGYDVDSRSAEATYRACLEIALKLRGALGDSGLSALAEACQDY